MVKIRILYSMTFKSRQKQQVNVSTESHASTESKVRTKVWQLQAKRHQAYLLQKQKLTPLVKEMRNLKQLLVYHVKCVLAGKPPRKKTADLTGSEGLV